MSWTVQPIVRSYRKGDSERVSDLVAHGDMVLAVDPGAHGMALLFPPANLWTGGLPPMPVRKFELWGFGELDRIAVIGDELAKMEDLLHAEPPHVRASGRLMVVIEESFVGGRKNAATDLLLARYAGAVLGAVGAACNGRWHAAFVMPAVWQKALGVARAKRKDRKAAAKEHAIERLGVPAVETSAKLAPHREAFCDAYGIATWWGQFSRTPLKIRAPEGT